MTTTPAELIAELWRAHKTFNTIPHRQPEADLFGKAAAALEAAVRNLAFERMSRPPFGTWRGECGHLWERKDGDGVDCPICIALEAVQAGSRPQTHADLVAAHRALNGSTALSAARAVNRGWSPPQGSGDYVLARQLPDDVFADVVSWIKTAHRDMADADCDAETVAENVAVNIWDVLRAMISASDGGPQ